MPIAHDCETNHLKGASLPSPVLDHGRLGALLLVFLLGLGDLVSAQNSNAESPTPPRRPFAIDDIVNQESVRSLELSPDGSRLLWIRMRPDKEKDRMAPTLMLTELPTENDAEPEHRELTVGRWDISSPEWSPDSQRIAFLSRHDFPDGVENLPKDDRGAQIWTLDLRGGVARPLTKVPHGVRSFAWRSDDEFLLTARIPKTQEEKREAERKDKTEDVEDIERFRDTRSLLWSFTIKGSRLRRLVDGKDTSIGRFSMAPSGRHVVCWHEVDPRHGAQNDRPPRVLVHDLLNRSSQELWAGRRNKPSSVTWKSDTYAFVTAPKSTVDGEDLAAVTDLYELLIEDRTAILSTFDLRWERGLTSLPVISGDRVFLHLANGHKPVWAALESESIGLPDWKIVQASGLPRIQGVLGRRETSVRLAIAGNASTPDAIHRIRFEPNADASKFVDEGTVYRPNDGFDQLEIARAELISWKGALEEEIEGILYYPADYEEGRSYPLVLVTHGGPHAADSDRFTERWANTPNLYAGRGAFVLKTNYHGSSDYGLEFGESIKGRYYELELIDMARGIQKLIDDGKADPDQLGLVGWSNGAILSIAMLTHLDDYLPGHGLKFKACAPGAGDVNWTSDFGNCAFGASFDRFYVGGAPWNQPEAYFQKSPLFRMEEVETPTIVFFGSEDKAVPTEQGWQHFRAMQSIGKADVKFLLFPGEGHGLAKLSHQRRKLVEELAWFDQFLFETERSTWPEKLSRLDELQRVPALRDRNQPFGVQENGILVPEMIPVRLPYDSEGGSKRWVRVSRFEITHAQWTAFAPQNGRNRGSNMPAVGMTQTQAIEYIDWLNTTTGRRFRLPERAELEALKGSREENTIARWAGFEPNLDEARKLEQVLDSMDPDAVLWPVGTGRATVVGEGDNRQLLFDLGGNAAELAADGDQFSAFGPCVARRTDDSADAQEFPQAFTGLRLIEEIESEKR
ncbi:MAG: prolyl oligopeptidase family serine peptidase [Planctomycetota bacterium]